MNRKLSLSVLCLVLFCALATTGWGQNVNATWSAGGSAWYTTTNWVGGTAFPGVKSAATATTNVATFTSTTTAATVGINCNTSSLSLGCIYLDPTKTSALNIGNSSTTANGTIALYGYGSGSSPTGLANNTIIQNSSSGTLTMQYNQTSQTFGVVLSNATDNIITINGSGGVIMGTAISGTGMHLTANGTGSGTLTLGVTGGPTNTYTGGTTVSGSATLVMGLANTLPSTGTITLNGGTWKTGTSGGFSQSTGPLNLTANSALTLGTGSHTITISNSSAQSWTTGTTLTINGWTGTAGASGTAGKIMVGVGGLTSGQLSQISFTGFPGTPLILPSGELVPQANCNSTAFTACPNGSQTASLNWTASGCSITAQLIVASAAGSTVTSFPTATSGYSAGGGVWGSGTTNTLGIASGEYVVYYSTGTGTSQTVSNLTNGSATQFRMFTLSGGTWSSGIVASATPEATTSYYWNGATPSALPAAGGTSTWQAVNSWRQPDANGCQANWADGYPAYFGGTAGTVTMTATQSTPGISFLTTGYTLTGSTLALSGSTPTINLSGNSAQTQTIISNVSSANLVNVNQAPATGGVLNLNSGSNVFTGGITINQTLRLNGNCTTGGHSFGTAGNAGPITFVSGTSGSSVTNANTAGTNTNTVYNNIVLNSGGSLPYFITLGATKGGTGLIYTINYNGAISGASDVYLGNGQAGAGGAGATMFSSSSNTYTGKTYFNPSTAGYFQCGATNCFPLTNQFIFGEGTATGTSPYGAFDLNGYSQTWGSLESQFASGLTGPQAITNSSATAATITISGGGTSNTNATYAGVIGAETYNTSISASSGNNISFVMNASGATETLSGANTYTGNTTLSAGSLFINGSLASGSAVSTLAGTTFGGNGTAAGTVSLSGTLAPGSATATVGALTTGAFTFNANSTYKFEVSNAGAAAGTGYDELISTGPITCSASPITIDITSLTGITFSNSTAYTWTIASGSSISGFNPANFTLLTTNFAPSLGGGSFNIAQSGNTIVINFVPVVPSLTPSPAALSGFTYNYGAGPSAAQSFTVSGLHLTGGAGTITILGSTDFEVSTTSSSSGFGSSATLSYTGTSTISPNTVWVRLITGLSAGSYNETLSIYGGGVTSGSPATVSVSGNVIGSYYWNGNNVSTLNGTWDNTTTNWTYPAATATLNSTWPSTGSTSIANFLGAGGGTINLPNTLAAAPVQINIGSSNFVFTGTTPTIPCPISLGGDTLTFSPTGTTANLNGIISGTGGAMIFNGAGTTTIPSTVANTYTGTTSILAGVLIIGNDANLGTAPSSATAGNIVIDGGSRLTTTPACTINPNRGIALGNVSGNSISITGSGNISTYNGIMADRPGSTPGQWAKQGAGTLILGGHSTYTGITAINNGIVQIGVANALPTGTLLTIGQASSTNLGTLDLHGNNQSVAGINSVNGSGTAGNNIIECTTGSANLTVTGNGSYSYGVNTTSNTGIIQGPVSLIINATGGTQALGNANTYTGSTTVTAGTLLVNGSTSASSAVTVATAGTLGGSGTAAGTVSLSGTVSPGSAGANSNGILSTGAFTFNASSTYKFEVSNAGGVAGSGYDQISSSGAITCSSSPITIDITSLTGITFSNTSSYSWTIATGASVSGFSASNFVLQTTNFAPTLNGVFQIVQSGNSIVLQYNAFCWPTFTHASASSSDYLTSVSIPGTTLSDAGLTALASPYYTLRPSTGSTTASLYQGSTYTVSFISGASYADNVGVWIDFNQDGTFQSSEYVGNASIASHGGTASLTISVPSGANTGATRMRVIMDGSGATLSTAPCTSVSYGEDLDYIITILPVTSVPSCATTPVPADGATGVCATGGGAITAVTWATAASASSYDVYFGTSSTPPLVSTSQTAVSYSVGTLSNNTTYYWKVVPKNFIGSATGCSTYSFTTGSAPCYCTAASSTSQSSSQYISNVTLGSINNNTSYSTYTDYTSLSTNLNENTAFTLYVTEGGAHFSGDAYYVWIDYNQNGIFESGELIANGVAAPSTVGTALAINFTVPTTSISLGTTRMRVRLTGTTGGNTSSCGSSTYGEVEDYDVVIYPNCTIPTITSSTGAVVCNSGSMTLTAASSAGTINWYASATGGTSLGTGTSFNTPTLTNTTLYYADATVFTGCTSSPRVAVSAAVAGAPLNLTAAPSVNPVCNGSTINLFAKVPAPQDTLLQQNFNGSSNNWTSGNTSTSSPASPSLASWTLEPDGYNYSGTTFHSNDNSQFYLSNADGLGSGASTNTWLASPSINTQGLSSLTMTYYQYFRSGSGGTIAVEVSTDGGSTFSTAYTSTATQGASSAFTLNTVNLNSYVNYTGLIVRFHFTGGWSYYWAVDNVVISGAQTISSYSWSSVPSGFSSAVQNPVNVSLSSSTTYTVTATNNYGCTATASTPLITINPRPTANFTGGATSICVGAPETYTVAFTGTGPWNYQIDTVGGVISGTTGSSPVSFTMAPHITKTVKVTALSDANCSSNYSDLDSVIIVPTTTCTVTWVGATSSNWNTASNWNPTLVPNSCSVSASIPAGTAHSPVISTTNIQVGSLTMSAGSRINLSGYNLSLCKDLSGLYGVYINGTGSLIFDGSTTQHVSGTINVDKVTIDNTGSGSSNVVFNTYAVMNVYSGMTLEVGNLNVTASGTAVNLLSTNVDTVAYLNDFGGNTGTFTGNLSVHRKIAVTAGIAWQHQVSSPVSGNTFSQLYNEGNAPYGYPGTGAYLIPASNCSEDSISWRSPYSSAFNWVESNVNPTTPCVTTGWKTVAISDSWVQGKGYSVYLNSGSAPYLQGQPNTGNISVTGCTNSGWTFASPATVNTPYAHTDNSGWSMVGNPYPSGLIMNTARTAQGFDGQVQVYHPSGLYIGTYSPVQLATSTLYLAPFQGFMVHKTAVGGTATWPFYQSERTTSVGAQYQYYKLSENAMTVQLRGNGFADQTRIEFNSGATDGFDVEFDADKFPSQKGQPTLFSVIPGYGPWGGINVLGELTKNTVVALGLQPGSNGTFTLSFDPADLASFPPSVGIYLEDKHNAANWMNVRNQNSYTFSSDVNDELSRFALHFSTDGTTGIAANDANASTDVTIFSSGENVLVDFSKLQSVDATIQIYNVLGQELSNEEHHTADVYSHEVVSAEAAYVIVKVKLANGQVSSKKLFLMK